MGLSVETAKALIIERGAKPQTPSCQTQARNIQSYFVRSRASSSLRDGQTSPKTLLERLSVGEKNPTLNPKPNLSDPYLRYPRIAGFRRTCSSGRRLPLAPNLRVEIKRFPFGFRLCDFVFLIRGFKSGYHNIKNQNTLL